MLNPQELHNLKVAFIKACQTRMGILSVINDHYREMKGKDWDYISEFGDEIAGKKLLHYE